ncbi:hypothetical protein GCM10028895_46990 [Pontibacter rugosus]
MLLDNDFRHYLNIGKESQLVTRLVTGAGYAYGNATTLPYVKQFSVGGPNSIRAFRARSIGPGTFTPEDPNDSFSFFDQVGDIRLVGNVEYRFPIVGFFKGAVFWMQVISGPSVKNSRKTAPLHVQAVCLTPATS